MTDLTIPIPGKFTRTSLELESRLTYDDWRSVGLNLAQLRDWGNFAIGDWLEYGEVHYGEQYSQAASDTGISEDKLMILKHVSSRVPPLLRRKSLSWSHHLEVAKLKPDEQKSWLDMAEKKVWSVRDLQQELTEAGLRKTVHRARLREQKDKPVVSVAFIGTPEEKPGDRVEMLYDIDGTVLASRYIPADCPTCDCCGDNGTQPVHLCASCFDDLMARNNERSNR